MEKKKMCTFGGSYVQKKVNMFNYNQFTMRKLYYSLLLAVLFFAAGTTLNAQGLADDKPVMSIGCLSDLHNELGLISSSNVNNVKLRGTIVNTVNKMREEEDIDLIVLGGDYTSDVTIPEANWERIRDLMHDALRSAFHPEREKKPVIYVTGNHDYEVANFDNLPKPYNAARYYDFIMKDDIGELTEKDAFYEEADNGSLGKENLLAAFHYEINGFDFIALNCGKFFFASAWDYSYSLASVEWVGQKLAELYEKSPNRTVFFLLHVPFQDSNSISNINKGMGGRGSAEGVQSAKRLKEILAQYPNVIMLYGHDHGSDNAYIRSKTSQRVTRYNSFGNVIATTDETHVDEIIEGQEGGGEEEVYTPEAGSVKGYFKSYSGDGYMNYLSTSDNLQCGTAKTEATIAASTSMKDRYTILLNGGYTHLGSTAHFTGNTAITMYSSPYIFKVEDPAASTVKAHRVHKLSEFNKGGHFVILGYAKKDGQWYMMGSENVTITYPGLAGLLYSADEPGEDIEFTAYDEHSPIWEFECTTPKADEEPTPTDEPAVVNGFFESFAGDGFLNYVSTSDNLQCGTVKNTVSIAHATAYTGRYTVYVNNSGYIHLGSTNHFTGNTAISDYSTPYIYHVPAPVAGTTVKAQRITSLLDIKPGQYYALASYAKGDKKWHLMTSENVTISYPGLAAQDLSDDVPGEEIEIELGDHAPVWKFVTESGENPGEEPGEEPASDASYYLQNKANNGYLCYGAYNAETQEVPARVIVTPTATSGVFNVTISNGQYLYCGSAGYFSGNDAANDIWFYDATDGSPVTKVEVGKSYYVVGYKQTKYYALSSEVIRPGTGNQRLLSVAVEFDADGKLIAPEEADKYIWTLGEMPKGTPSFLSAFMGSMRYYSNSIEGDVSVTNSKIVQALMVYIHPDRIVLKMKNYGSSGNFGGIQIQKELAGYTIFREVENANGSIVGVNNLTGDVLGSGKTYDLSGRRVSHLGKGVYIVDGKKILR
ncbi:MAG: metallophosphoesterase [Alloprevotella sp.]|nr:metallophosphoesterase [Alloprevotella sp.]